MHRAVGRLRRFATAAGAAQRPAALLDSFGRVHSYLRVSVTERCNLRCTYCMPEEGVPLTPREGLLADAEIARVVRLFARRGVQKVRITGGEPLVRKGVVGIVAAVSAVEGVHEVGITTNGLVLGRYASDLVHSGLTGVNVSLDTMIEERFWAISRRFGVARVVNVVERISSGQFPGLKVKVNCVVMKGVNDDEIPDFVRLTQHADIDVRFIEYMPFGGNRWSDGRFLAYSDMLEMIGTSFGALERASDGPNDTCKHYRIPGFKGRIGFITSMTNHFCGTCNRLRVTADGNLKVCLFGNDELSLRDAMRAGATDDDLDELVDAALLKKHFALGGNKDMYEIADGENRSMIRIGG